MMWLRSAVFAAWFYGLTAAMGVIGLAWRLLSWRRSVGYARFWGRLVLGGLRLICGIRYQVSGLDRLTPGPALLAAMHQSAFDTLVWMLLAPDFCFVLKHELTRVPLFGPLLLHAGMIPVDRRAGVSAMRGMLREADRALAQERQIVIFPEGTRMPPGAPGPLQPGIVALAARTRLPVIPVTTDSGLFWGRRAFLKRPGTIHIALHEPLAASLPREELLARLATIYAEARF